MPYIKQDQRVKLEAPLKALIDTINSMPEDFTTSQHLAQAGILNYCCTRLLLEVIPVRSYWAIALKSGVIRNIADEYYRKYAAKYEEEKIKENGDVY